MLAAIAHLVSASHLECHFGNLKDGNLNAWNTMIVKTVGMLTSNAQTLDYQDF